MTRIAYVAALALAILSVLVVLNELGAGDEQASEEAPPERRPAFLVDADAHGAIVLDLRSRALIGYDSDGSVAWKDGRLGRREPEAVCLRRCPDAVASGAAATLDRPDVADPPIVFHRGDRRIARRVEVRGDAGKGGVLWAASPSEGIEWRAGLNGSLSLLLRAREHVLRVPLPRAGSAPAPSGTLVNEDGTRALLLIPRREESGRGQPLAERRWFEREPGLGWRERARGTGTGRVGCIDAAGRRAVVLADSPELLIHPRTDGPVLSRLPAGACVFSSIGPVLASFSAGPAGARSTVVQLDEAGRTRWRSRSHELFNLFASEASDAVVLERRRVVELVDGQGRRIRTLRGVIGARPLPDGRLVVLLADGTVEWLRY